MTEILKQTSPEPEELSPQPFDIFVKIKQDESGKIVSLSPIRDSVENAALWMDRTDRKIDITDYPDQSFGDIIVSDEKGMALTRIPVGLLNDYLHGKEGRPLDGIRDILAHPSPRKYELMILSRLRDADVIDQVNTGYEKYRAADAEKKALALAAATAVSVSPKDALDAEKNKNDALIAAETKKREAELKASKWTDEEIMKLLSTVKINNATTLPGLKQTATGGAESDPRRGDPEEFSADLIRIKDMFSMKDIVIEGRKKEQLTPEAKDVIIAAFLSYHLDTMGYAREMTDDGKIIIHDTTGKNKKTAALLQEKLDSGRVIFPDLQREILKSGDNVSRFAHSIAVTAYYHEGKDLMSVQQNLREKAGLGPMFHISPVEIAEKGEKWKEYIAHREQEKKKILAKGKDKSLSASEISFLLAWDNDAQKGELTKIQQEQSEWVENAVKNWNKKSARQKQDYLLDHPITGSMGTILAAAFGGGALLMGMKMTFGPESKWWQRFILGPLCLLFGIPVGGAMLEKGAKAIGLTDALKDTDIMFPEKNKDNPIHRFSSEAAEKISHSTPDIINSFKRLLVSSNEDIELAELLGDEKMKGIQAEYSITDMLYALGDETIKNDKNYTPNPETLKKIKATMSGLNEDGREKLKKILSHTWEKFTNLPKNLHMTIEDKKKQRLPDILVAMDTENGWDKWKNQLPNWAGGGKHDQLEAMKVMMPNADKWLNFSLEEIKNFVDGTADKRMLALMPSDIADQNKIKSTIKDYIDGILTEDNKAKKLKEVL